MEPARVQFEVRYRASGGTTLVVSRSDDADAATLAFHSVLVQLCSERRDGDVLLVKQDPGDRVVLRHRLDASVQPEWQGERATRH